MIEAGYLIDITNSPLRANASIPPPPYPKWDTVDDVITYHHAQFGMSYDVKLLIAEVERLRAIVKPAKKQAPPGRRARNILERCVYVIAMVSVGFGLFVIMASLLLLIAVGP